MSKVVFLHIHANFWKSKCLQFVGSSNEKNWTKFLSQADKKLIK